MSNFFGFGANKEKQNTMNNQYPNNDNNYNNFNNMNNSNNNYNNINANYVDNNYNNNNNYNPQGNSNMGNYTGNSETFVYNSNFDNMKRVDTYANEPTIKPNLYNSSNNQMSNQANNLNNQYNNMPNMNNQPNVPNNTAFNANNANINSSDILENEVLEMPIPDPLNNANNPIPVNPVAAVKTPFIEEELPKNVKASIFSVIGMALCMILTPGTTIVNNSKKYRKTSKAIMITIWITLVTFLLCIGVRIITGAFTKTYSAITGTYRINFDFTNIFKLENYAQPLILAFIFSFVIILITAIIYYASSFINSKGIPFGSYLMVSNLALIPFIIGIVAIYPVVNLFSTYIGILALIFTFLYSLVSFMIGINNVLSFSNVNREILYNVLNLSVIILVVIVLFVILINTSVIIPPELNL